MPHEWVDWVGTIGIPLAIWALGWAQRLKNNHDNLHEEFHALELKIAERYVSHVTLDTMKTWIDTRMNKMEDKIDRLARRDKEQ